MRAFISIGSNIGEKLQNCLRAISLLDNLKGCKVIKKSSFYKTEPVGYKEQDWFINCAVLIDTKLDPYELLDRLQQIEILMGREKSFKWGPRLIDLDLLLYEDIIMDEEKLTIPHPLMHKRRFVLIPISELAPDLIHPVLNKPVIEILRSLPEDGQSVILVKS